MSRERGNPLRPLCDGCQGRWQGEHEQVSWRGGRKLCSSCVTVESKAERSSRLTPEERRPAMLTRYQR